MMEREKLHEDLETSEEVREMLDEKEKARQKWIIQQQKENLTAIDAFQAALDVVGLEPTRWSIADWTNALIYLFRSAKAKYQGNGEKSKAHLIDAWISAISLIPFADVIKLLRLRKYPKLAKIAIKGARLGKNVAKEQKIKRSKNQAL